MRRVPSPAVPIAAPGSASAWGRSWVGRRPSDCDSLRPPGKPTTNKPTTNKPATKPASKPRAAKPARQSPAPAAAVARQASEQPVAFPALPLLDVDIPLTVEFDLAPLAAAIGAQPNPIGSGVG
jgi:hypothetical protein